MGTFYVEQPSLRNAPTPAVACASASATHTEYFDIDEDTLQLGLRAMSATVPDYLQRD